jgi:hypothetical protein
VKIHLVFALIFSVLIFGGCFAHKFSSSLLPFKEDNKTKVIFGEIVLAVASPVSGSYGLTKATDAIQKLSLFKEVGSIDELPQFPDLILDSWIHEGEGNQDPFRNCSLGFEGEMLTISMRG